MNALQTGGREEGFGMPSNGIAAITQRLNGAAASFEARVEKKKKEKEIVDKRQKSSHPPVFVSAHSKACMCVYVVCDIHRRTVRAGEALNQRPREE